MTQNTQLRAKSQEFISHWSDRSGPELCTTRNESILNMSVTLMWPMSEAKLNPPFCFSPIPLFIIRQSIYITVSGVTTRNGTEM